MTGRRRRNNAGMNKNEEWIGGKREREKREKVRGGLKRDTGGR